MNTPSSPKSTGFAVFPLLMGITVVAIVAVVGYVMFVKPMTKSISTLPLQMATPVPASTTPESTPLPSVSPSTDIEVIGKELNETKIESVDSEFASLDSSAASL